MVFEIPRYYEPCGPRPAIYSFQGPSKQRPTAITVEIVPELAESARKTLSTLGYFNVLVRQGDGYQGWPAQAPFDRILVTAAPSEVPKALIEQLAIGGRLIAPIGPGWVQELIVVDKKPEGTVQRSLGPSVMFIPMRPSHN